MNYKETTDYLFSQLPMYQQQGASAYKGDLSNTLFLDELTNHPHRRFKTIHVAGSNGKGSVSHMLAAILQTAGYKVGLYTSPHLKDFRERIRINGTPISEQGVIDFVERYKDGWQQIHPSFFEITVAMAFDYFSKQKIDIAVVETGLGGRLDSTNIITPEITVITNISLDHTQILGNTVEAIAGEKAGIIKHAIPIIIGEKEEKTAEVFINRANAVGAPLYFASEEIAATITPEGFSIDQKRIETDLTGSYQRHNLATVWQAVKLLQESLSISKADVLSALKNVKELTGLRGRWEILNAKPLIICDTGHNEAGIKHIIEQLNGLPKKELRIVLGVVNDKDLSLILPLFPKDAIYYFTQPAISRSLPKETLKNEAEKYNLQGQCYDTPRIAMEAAKQAANDNDLIFVGGSTFMVADIL